jgi:putative addiction module killer protein
VRSAAYGGEVAWQERRDFSLPPRKTLLSILLRTTVRYAIMICSEDALTKIAQPKRIIVYTDDTGAEPFTDWVYGLRDTEGRNRILARIRRLEQGNYGDCAPVGEGVSELRMFFGPGYRVYFGERENNIVILLCGGDKDTQTRDIAAAKTYWKEHLSHEKL